MEILTTLQIYRGHKDTFDDQNELQQLSKELSTLMPDHSVRISSLIDDDGESLTFTISPK